MPAHAEAELFAAAPLPDALQPLRARAAIYLLHGPSRWAWQHSVAPTAGLRYSITFRTLRPAG